MVVKYPKTIPDHWKNTCQSQLQRTSTLWQCLCKQPSGRVGANKYFEKSL